MASKSAEAVPIANLQPKILNSSERHVLGVVTLIWPYSSATRSSSFLLVEPDFRLRAKRGQVRVQFYGSSAKALSRAGIASGVELSLSLRGAQWTEDKAANSTPGSSIDWSLSYGEFLKVQVRCVPQRCHTC